jgi:hypothetical protein
MLSSIGKFIRNHVATTICVGLLLSGVAYAATVSLTYGTGTLLDTLAIALDPNADGDPSDCTAITAKQDAITDGSIGDGYVNLADLDNLAKELVTTQATTGASDTVEITGYFNDYKSYVLTITSDTTAQALTLYDEVAATPPNGTVLKIINGGANTLVFADTSGVQEIGATITLNEGNSITFVYITDRWFCTGSDTTNLAISSLDMGGGTFDVPNSNADVALADAGKVHLNTTDEQLSFHSAADGEISGEVSIGLIQTKIFDFDPVTLGATTLRRLPIILSIGDDAPEGIVITEWKVSFDADPTDELEFDLKRADAFLGVANAAVIDVCDTTNGVSSEDTNASINGGAAIANGKCVYIEQDATYAETGHVVTVQIWYYCEED